MTKRAVPSVRSLARIVALCVVALQLVNVLHFSLVSHGFGASASGFVHLHRALSAAPERAPSDDATQGTSNRPTLVMGSASSSTDACPLGFSGPPLRPLASSAPCALIWLPVVAELAAREHVVSDRSRALLRAPKTSPPHAV